MATLGPRIVAETEPRSPDAVEEAGFVEESGDAQLAELRRQLLEKEAEIQVQHRALSWLRTISKEQDATIKRLEAEIGSYRGAVPEIADARDRARELELLNTRVAFLEETIATRGALIEEQLTRMQALHSGNQQLRAELGVLQGICEERNSLIERLSRQIREQSESNPYEQAAAHQRHVERLSQAVQLLRRELAVAKQRLKDTGGALR
jgi:myosin heavy subunit